MRLHVAVGGAAQALVDRVPVDRLHDLPRGLRLPVRELFEDLLLAHFAVADVRFQPRARIADQRAVARAKHLQVGQLEQAAQRGHVGADVADDGGADAEHGVAGEEHAVFLDVVAERIDAVARRRHHLHLDPAVQIDHVAVGERAHAVRRQPALEQLDAGLRHGHLGLQGLVDVLEVAGMVEVVVRDRRDADLAAFHRGEVALQHPLEFIDRLAGIDRQRLALADDVDVGRGRAHRLGFGHGDHADGIGDAHQKPSPSRPWKARMAKIWPRWPLPCAMQVCRICCERAWWPNCTTRTSDASASSPAAAM